MNFHELKQKISDSGIVGAGGAGFPTHIKLNENAETIILNCAECEPLIQVDQQLIGVYTKEILTSLNLLVESMGAKNGIIAIKEKYKNAITSINDYIDQYPLLKLHLLPNVYPSGDEVVLIYETTGKVVPKGSIPISVGAVVVNVETVLNIYEAVYQGKAVTSKYVTVIGEVNNPITIRVPIGTSVRDIIKMAGGLSLEDVEIIMGGPMTGKIVSKNAPVTKTTKAIIVLPKDHQLILKKISNTPVHIKKVMSVCSQCRMCTDLCPRNLLGHKVEPHKLMNALANGITSDLTAYTTALGCCDCGVCEMYACHHDLSPRSLMMECKQKLLSAGIKPEAKESYKVHSARENRYIPSKRLVQRLGLSKYDVEAKIDNTLKEVNKVEILLTQHIGAPGMPQVEKEVEVKKGDIVAVIPEGKLGSIIHASIDGIIENVSGRSITIRARGEQDE